MSAVKRFLGGDVTAVDEVLVELGPRLRACLRVKYKCTLADDELEEIANVAVERGWRRRATFDLARGAFEAWLWRIASTDENSHTTLTNLDVLGRSVSVTNAAGGVTSKTYDNVT